MVAVELVVAAEGLLPALACGNTDDIVTEYNAFLRAALILKKKFKIRVFLVVHFLRSGNLFCIQVLTKMQQILAGRVGILRNFFFSRGWNEEYAALQCS